MDTGIGVRVADLPIDRRRFLTAATLYGAPTLEKVIPGRLPRGDFGTSAGVRDKALAGDYAGANRAEAR
jgi:hypothetical protein